MSAPVRRPVTPMLPPKNWFGTVTKRTGTPAASASSPASGASTRAPYSPVTSATGSVGSGSAAGAGDGRAVERGAHVGLELPCHADAVLVLRVPVVLGRRREGAIGEEVVLVGRVREPSTECVLVPRLPGLDRVDDLLGLRTRVGAHVGLGGVVAHAERDDADRREAREAIQDPEQRVVERVAGVDARAHDNLAVHLDAAVKQRREPPQARRATTVAQQAR